MQPLPATHARATIRATRSVCDPCKQDGPCKQEGWLDSFRIFENRTTIIVSAGYTNVVRTFEFAAIGALVVVCLGESVVTPAHAALGAGHFLHWDSHSSTLSFGPGVPLKTAHCREKPRKSYPFQMIWAARRTKYSFRDKTQGENPLFSTKR